MAYVISIRRGVFADKLALLPNGGGKGGGPFYSQAPKEKGKIYVSVYVSDVYVYARIGSSFELTRAETGPTHERTYAVR